MSRSLIYKYPFLYRLLMFGLYGRGYINRFQTLGEYIEPNSSVIDLCSGFGDFYKYGLRAKTIEYTGIDLSNEFSIYARRRGINVIVGDIENFGFPIADYYIITDSLYHFHVNAKDIIKRMLESSRKKVLIMEPIRNLTNSKHTFISKLAKHFTNEGKGQNNFRFSETTLDNLMNQYFQANIIESKLTPNGRDKIYVLKNIL